MQKKPITFGYGKYIVHLPSCMTFFNNVKPFRSGPGEGWWLDSYRVGVLSGGKDRKRKKHEGIFNKGMVVIDNED